MTEEKTQQDKTPSDASLPSVESPAEMPVVDFASIAKGSTTVLIRLDDSLYTLRRTKNNRLILQK
ncbi:MAG: hemin uptake protein HemP [Planctomycetota bacterium]